MKARPYAIGFVLLAMALAILACSFASVPQIQGRVEAATAPAAQAITRAASPTAPPPKPSATAAPTALPSTATVAPTVEPTAAGPYVLKISDSYPLFTAKLVIGVSLAARQGRVWIGTISGSIQEVDAKNGAFGREIKLVDAPGPGNASPIIKMRFEGDYLWAYLSKLDMGETPFIYAINPSSGEITRQWDLNSPEWREEERQFSLYDFGASDGKIWVDEHIIDAQTLEVIPDVPMPAMAMFADGGKGWMWMTGEMGGACDDLLLVSTADPKKEMCPEKWPFMSQTDEGFSPVNPTSPLVLAGDRMWIAGSISGTKPEYLLEAYPVDMDQAMQAKGPLAGVPLIDSEAGIKLFYAGNYLWVVYTLGDYAGYLYQLDPKTGETINSLDLVGDEGRSISDIPMDIAAEGDNLWVLTSRQLVRIKLPKQ